MSSFTNALWISLLGILVTVGTPLFHRWYSSEKIAFVSTHTSINKPAEAVWANRHFNYSQPDFVQTWDFIIVDAQATNSFAITYGVRHVDNHAFITFRRLSAGSTADAELSQSFGKVKFTAHSNIDFDVGSPTYMRSRSSDEIKLRASFSESDQLRNIAALQWNLELTRLHGWSGVSEHEESNNLNHCNRMSVPFASNAAIAGQLIIDNETIDFDQSLRYRVTASTQWGCDKPSTWHSDTNDAAQYSTTTVWMALPEVEPELSVWFSSRRTRTGTLVGDTQDLQLAVSGGTTDTRFSARAIDIWRSTRLNIGLLASCSDESNLGVFNVTHERFADYSDSFGAAALPQRIAISVVNKQRRVSLQFLPKPQQFHRFLVPMSGGTLRSNFVAVGVRARVIISQIDVDDDAASNDFRVVYDQTIDTLSAVQFSYAAPLQQPASRSDASTAEEKSEL